MRREQMNNQSASAKRITKSTFVRFLLATVLIQVILSWSAYVTGWLSVYAPWAVSSTLLVFVYLIRPALADYRKRQGASVRADIPVVTLGVTAASLAISESLAAIGAGVLVLGRAALLLFSVVQQHAGAKSVIITLTAAATILVGALFFYFRLKQRFLYGATEAVAGVLVAAHRVSIEPGIGLPTDSAFYFAFLTAGVYLVVRGLDNMHNGIKAGESLARYVCSWPGGFGRRPQSGEIST
jgi:hypothetical protein